MFVQTAKRSETPAMLVALIVATALAVSVFAAITTARAGATVTVAADRAKVVRIAGEPATVVVGNPMYADVSVREGILVVHGKMFGSTNIIAIDADGKELAQFEVNVVGGGTQSVSVFKAGSRYSLNCAGACQSDLQVGDNPDYFDNTLRKQISAKSGLAAKASK